MQSNGAQIKKNRKRKFQWSENSYIDKIDQEQQVETQNDLCEDTIEDEQEESICIETESKKPK